MSKKSHAHSSPKKPIGLVKAGIIIVVISILASIISVFLIQQVKNRLGQSVGGACA